MEKEKMQTKPVKRLATIKFRIIMISVALSLVITILVSTYNYSLFKRTSLSNRINSIQYKLQTISNNTREKGRYIDNLIKWFNSNGTIAEYLYAIEVPGPQAIATHDRIVEELQNNPSLAYIDRLVLATKDRSKYIHISGDPHNGDPVTSYNLAECLPDPIPNDKMWYPICKDPYFTHTMQKNIIPIYNTVGKKGDLFIAISPAILLDEIPRYQLDETDQLYITMGNFCYRLQKDSIIPIKLARSENYYKDLLTGQKYSEVTIDFETYLLIDVPLGIEGLMLTQAIPITITIQKNAYLTLLFIILILIVFLGIMQAYSLNRLITIPLFGIKRKLFLITKGDFSRDIQIEGTNEIGEIGKNVNDMAIQLNELIELKVFQEKEKHELEYSILQSRVNPHFLYNTLNSIKWMATIQNSQGIANMATSLSRLMKNIAKSTNSLITLKDELTLLDDYIVIEKYRYGGTLQIEKNIDESLLETLIPRFTLQTLVENAIFHGIAPKGEPGLISLTIESNEEGKVTITITDNGLGMDIESLKKLENGDTATSGMFKAFGIRSVKERISHNFGLGFGLTFQSKRGEGTTAILTIPTTREEPNEL
jgi:two-component system sensor histidine kinase YesM